MTSEALLLKAYTRLGWVTLNEAREVVIDPRGKVEKEIATTFIDDVMLQWNSAIAVKKVWCLALTEGVYDYTLPTDFYILEEIYDSPSSTELSEDPFYVDLMRQLTLAPSGSLLGQGMLLASDILDFSMRFEQIFTRFRKSINPGADCEILDGKTFRLVTKVPYDRIYVLYRRKASLSEISVTHTPLLAAGLAAYVAEHYVSQKESTPEAIKVAGIPSGGSRDGLTSARIDALRKEFADGLELLRKRLVAGAETLQ